MFDIVDTPHHAALTQVLTNLSGTLVTSVASSTATATSFHLAATLVHPSEVQPSSSQVLMQLTKLAKDRLLITLVPYGEAMLVTPSTAVSSASSVETQEDIEDNTTRFPSDLNYLRMVVANLPVILFALDSTGAFTLLEGQGLDLLGLDANDVIGSSFFERYESLPRMIRGAKRAFSGETVQFEIAIAEADTYFELYFSPLYDSEHEITGMLGVSYNISDRKRAQNSLEKAQRVANFGNFVLDLTTSELDVSDHVYDMLAFPRDLVPTLDLVTMLMSNEDAAKVREALHVSSEHNADGYVEYQITLPDGKTRNLHMRWQAISDQTGRVYQLFGTLQDVTAIRQAEARLTASNKRLAFINTLGLKLNQAASADDIANVLIDVLRDVAGPRSRDTALQYITVNSAGDPQHCEIIGYHSTDATWQTALIGMQILIEDYAGAELWRANPNRLTVLEDAQNDPRLNESEQATFAELDIASVLFMPLTQGGRWIGLVSMSWRNLYSLSEDEKSLLQAVARSLAPIVQNRRLVDNLEQIVTVRNRELEESQQLLRTTLDNATSMIVVKNLEGCYLLANQPFANFLGQDMDSIVGQRDMDILPRSVSTSMQRIDDAVLSQAKALSFEETIPSRQGQRSFWITKFPLFDKLNKVFAIGSITTEVTQQKQAEAAMLRYREQLAKTQVEVQITQRIQSLLLPETSEFQDIEGLEVASYIRPAEDVGGDYYDVLRIGDHLKLGIGDVTGHGLESGLLMLMTQTAVRALLVSGEKDFERILDSVNQTLFGNLQRMQVDKSLTLSLLDYHEGTLRISGQHEHVLIARTQGQVEVIDTIDLGLPLGLEADVKPFVAEARLELALGDSVVLFTDGITEAENASGERFGLTRLVSTLSEHHSQAAEALLDIIIDAVYQHTAGHVIDDDITLVVLKRVS
ncbi:MAG: SpoIIE family protein phosphatase [Deinococcota bacterium]